MTAPLRHPIFVEPGAASVSDESLEKALRTLAAVMDKHGQDAMALFDRLEAEYERRQSRPERIKRFLK